MNYRLYPAVMMLAAGLSLPAAVVTPSGGDIKASVEASAGRHTAPQQRVFQYPDEEVPEDSWYEWEDFTTAYINYGGFYGGYWEDDIPVQKRMSRDAGCTRYQLRIVGYFSEDDLIFEYDTATGKLRLPVQYFGVNAVADNAPLLISGYEEYWGKEDPYSSFDTKEGIIELYTIVYYPGQGGTGGVDHIELHGFTDYTVNVISDECVADFNHQVRLDIKDGRDACWELVNGLVVEGTYDAVIDRIAEERRNPLTASGTVEVTLTEGVNSMVGIAYDNNGQRKVTVKHIYCMPDDDANWTSLGTGVFSEDAVTGLNDDWGPVSVDVEVQEHKERPGFFRLVNPYRKVADRFADLEYTHDGHNHYLYIDATVPGCVLIPQQITGTWHERLMNMYITSKGYEEKSAGKMRVEYQPYCGTYKDGMITFPMSVIGIRLPEYYWLGDNIYWVNNSGKFTVEVPHSGVSGVAAESAEAEYYTLQGVPVAVPSAGEIMIVRRGDRVTKELIR